MHVLIVTPNYVPDLGPSAPLFAMLSKGLVQRGNQVTIVAAVPHYPAGIVYPGFTGQGVMFSVEDNVNIIRIPIPSLNRANLLNRLIQFACYQLGAGFTCLRQKFDVALVTNPALETWLPFFCVSVIKQKPVVYSIHDVYPDVGIKLGIFTNKIQIAAVRWFEQFCVNRSFVIRILSNSFRAGMHALGIPDEKMALIYDWVDTNLIIPMHKNNTFSIEQGLVDRFVVLYAGNIGSSQGLELVITTAKLLSNHNDVCFVFVGDGSDRVHLQDQAKQQNLANVKFIPLQPRERLPEVLASANVSLVILRQGIGSDSLPSKTFSILASGRPIIASVDENSETWNLVSQANAGICIPPENPSQLADAILAMKNDPDLRDRYGANGRQWAEQFHSPQYATAQFEKLLVEAMQSVKSH